MNINVINVGIRQNFWKKAVVKVNMFARNVEVRI